MKKIACLSFSMALMISTGFSVAQSASMEEKAVNDHATNHPAAIGITSPDTINYMDTVVFDLGQSVVSGQYLLFPIKFYSVDAIYSVDFEMRFNLSKIQYDSVINLTTFLQAFSFYNQNDSTLRFTSYSQGPQLPDNTSLALLRFRILGGPITASDFYPLTNFLNGTACSFLITDYLATGVDETIAGEEPVDVFPVPADQFVSVKIKNAMQLELLDMRGAVVIPAFQASPGTNSVETGNLSSGIYFLKMTKPDQVMFRRIVIE